MRARDPSSAARRGSAADLLYVSAITVLGLWTAIQAAAPPRASKWWLSHEIQVQLHLTREQVNDIDRIFESTLPARRALREHLDRLEGELQAAIDSSAMDEASVATLIERVEAARARRNVARTLMLYRMRKILTPQQRGWFDQRDKKSYGP
jgi:Spy/CpxP family protein refolding chaperone